MLHFEFNEDNRDRGISLTMATEYQINNIDDRKSPEIKKGHVFSRKRNFKDEKEKYLKMPLEEKRKCYVRQKHVDLDSVCAWDHYYHTNESRLQNLAAIFNREGEVNTALNKKVSLWRGDLTTLEIDAITNAAKQTLLGGAGVDGAIHSAAGGYLLAECKSLDGCATGDAKITGGYMLPARYVIHTVGPKGENPDKLESCYRTTLDVLKENGLRTVAFPCISTGIYGYKNEKAAPVAVRTVKKWLTQDNNADSVDRVIFCVFLPQDVDIYEEVLLQYFPVTEKTQEPESGPDIRSAAATSETSNEPHQSVFRDSSKRKLKKSRNDKGTCTLV